MYNFKESEDKITEYWKEKGIPDKARTKNSGKKKFYFMDGPPYATGHIHMGTALNKVLKDIVIRGKRMQGFDVFDKPGYDTHGMPIEYKVEKEIGVKSKKDIEKYGVKKFVEKCKEFATRFIGVMNSEFMDLGIWMDWEHPYITLEKEFIETNWWTFKRAFEKNLLYLGKYPIHVCPRCETAVAYNEIEYSKQEDKSIYVKFPLKKDKNKFLIIWTTTPWTLPGNTGVMVNPGFDYAEISVDGEKWILAKELADKVMHLAGKEYKMVRTFKGSSLEGLEYENPLSKHLKTGKLKNAYKVILSSRYVNLDDGTGLVHCAPGHGKEDYDASKKYNLDILSPVKINGDLTEQTGKYAGKKARVVDEEIIEDLKREDFLVANVRYSHDYPLCWRCSTPLIMISIPQWFFKISEIHNKLLSENDEINWTPSWAKLRMRAWLEGISDWPISRDRYWGTPLPIWICDKCEKKIVVESVSELEKISGQKVKEIHKPEIDKIEIKCKCGGKMRRTPEVLDVWFDSGVASWAALDYPRRKDLFDRYWPADFNIEGPDQFRGWWNSQLILSVIAFDKKPFEDIYVHGMVLDLGKRKMSKSEGNIVTPQEVMAKFGRDALRYYLSTINPGDDIKYDENLFRDINKFFTILFNVQNLAESEYGLKFTRDVSSNKIEDKWILSKLENLKKEAVENYNKYLFYKNSDALSRFLIEDVSRSYIQIVRERINDKDKKVGEVLNYILTNVALLMAPITPYISENLYLKMKGGESVHLETFLNVEKKNINKESEDRFLEAFSIIEKGLAERDKAQIGLKWPLASAVIHYYHELKELEELIKSQLNVKKITWKTAHAKDWKVQLDTKITPGLEAEGYAREVSRAIQAERKKAGLVKDQQIVLQIKMDKELMNQFEKYKLYDFIRKRVNAKSWSAVDIDGKIRYGDKVFGVGDRNSQYKSEFRIKDRDFKIFFNKSR